MKKLTIASLMTILILGMVYLSVGQVPSILPVSPVTESVEFLKTVTIHDLLTADILKLSGDSAKTGTGTISSVGTAVTGVGTAFTSELAVGTCIYVGATYQAVFSITNDTTLETAYAFDPVCAGDTFTYVYPVINTPQFMITNAGDVALLGNFCPRADVHMRESTPHAIDFLIENTYATDATAPARITFDRSAISGGTQIAKVGMDHTARDFFINVNAIDRLRIDTVGQVKLNPTALTGEIGLNCYSVNSTYSTIAQSDAEGIASSSDLRLALDPTTRNLIICERPDIATDFGLTASTDPAVIIYSADTTAYTRVKAQFFDFYPYGTIQSWGRILLRLRADLASGNFMHIYSDANIELTDTDVEQAWMYLEDKYNQTNTAAGGSILVKSLLTGVGDASSGKGYNFFADFRVDDTNDTSLYNIARMHIVKVHTSDLFDAAALTDSVTIWTQPANSRLENVVIVLEAQFVAAGMTDLDVTVGDAGDNDGILLEAMNLTSDAVGLDYSLKGAYWSATTAGAYYTTAAKAWLAYSTAVGANLSTTSAGEVIFYFIYTQY